MIHDQRSDCLNFKKNLHILILFLIWQLIDWLTLLPVGLELYHKLFFVHIANHVFRIDILIVVSLIVYYFCINRTDLQFRAYRYWVYLLAPVCALSYLFFERVLQLTIVNLFPHAPQLSNEAGLIPLQVQIYVHVIGPIFEELTYRKVYFDFLNSRFSSPFCVLMLSLVFGLSHFRDRPLIETIVPGVSSVVLFWLRAKLKDWKPGVLVHVLLNSNFP